MRRGRLIFVRRSENNQESAVTLLAITGTDEVGMC